METNQVECDRIIHLDLFRRKTDSVHEKGKQKEKEIGERTPLPFPERFELRGESYRCSEM
jgi:hypothetical protein